MRPLPIGIASGAMMLVLHATPAAAQDDAPSVSEASVVVGGPSPLSPILNGVISDPLFLPPKGKLYGQGETSLALERSDNDNVAGVRLYTSRRYDVGLSHGLAYGLTPTLSLHGSLGYSFNFEDDTTPAGRVSRSSSRSLDNTAVGATWRALDQRHHPFVVDLAVNYTPAILINDPGLRSVLSASVAVGRAMRALTVQVICAAAYQPKHSYLDAGAEVEERSTTGYTVALRTQVRFSPALSSNVTVNYGLGSNRQTIDHTNDLLLGEYQPAALTLSAGLNYQIIRSRLVFGLNYSRQFQGASTHASSDPSQTEFERNAIGNLITGTLNYAIN